MKIIYILFITCSFTAIAAAQNTPLIVNGHTESVNVVAYAPDGKTLVSGDKGGVLKSWDVLSGYKMLHSVQFSDASVSALSYSNAGDKIVAGTYRKLAIFNSSTLKRADCIKKAHATFVESAHFSPDDALIISSSWKEKAMVLWQSEGLKKRKELAESMWTDDVIFSPDAKYLLSANHANNVKVWDVETGNIVKTFAGHDDWVYSVDITSDQKTVITSSFDNTVKLWDFSSGKLLHTLKGHTDGIYLSALSADNKWLVTYSMDLTLKIWDLATLQEVYSFKPDAKILGMALSPDSRYLAAAMEDKTIAVYDLKTMLNQN